MLEKQTELALELQEKDLAIQKIKIKPLKL